MVPHWCHSGTSKENTCKKPDLEPNCRQFGTSKQARILLDAPRTLGGQTPARRLIRTAFKYLQKLSSNLTGIVSRSWPGFEG